MKRGRAKKKPASPIPREFYDLLDKNKGAFVTSEHE
jgi:hypothetical protein